MTEKSGIVSMKNVGGWDRILRALLGSTLVVVDFFATLQLEIVFLIVGLWGVLTSALGYCPFNGIIGRNTCHIRYDKTSTEMVAGDSI